MIQLLYNKKGGTAMRYHWLDEYLLQKRSVTKDLQPVWNWVRYMVGGKMFAAVCLDKQNQPYYINLKLDPSDGEFLRSQYRDILPGYYSDKRCWNSIRPDGAVPDQLLREMLDQSYALILASFPKKRQRELLGLTVFAVYAAQDLFWNDPLHRRTIALVVGAMAAELAVVCGTWTVLRRCGTSRTVARAVLLAAEVLLAVVLMAVVPLLA